MEKVGVYWVFSGIHDVSSIVAEIVRVSSEHLQITVNEEKDDGEVDEEDDHVDGDSCKNIHLVPFRLDSVHRFGYS